MHALALHVGARGLPDRKRLGVLAEVDADLLENGIGVLLERDETLLIEHLVIGNPARDVWHRTGRARGARGPFGIAAARSSSPARLRRRLRIVHARSPAVEWDFIPMIRSSLAPGAAAVGHASGLGRRIPSAAAAPPR